MKIHLIEHSNNFNKLHDDVWESGWWRLTEAKALELVGCEVYFHRKRTEPSFYGGVIQGYRVEPEGEFEGRIILEFEYSLACRNIKTDKYGWSKDIKIIEEE